MPIQNDDNRCVRPGLDGDTEQEALPVRADRIACELLRLEEDPGLPRCERLACIHVDDDQFTVRRLKEQLFAVAPPRRLLPPSNETCHLPTAGGVGRT